MAQEKYINELQLAQKGDMDAQEFIFKKYHRLVNKVVYQATGEQDEDLIATGYMGILKAIEQYDFNGDSSFSTVAYYKIKGIVSNELESRKKQKRCINYMDSLYSLDMALEEDNSEGRESTLMDTVAIDNGEYHGYQSIFDDETSSLFKAVKKLNHEFQVLFTLKYINELTDQQIADQLGVTKGKVTWNIRKLRRELNDIMGLDYDIPGTVSSKKQKRDRSHLAKHIVIGA